MIHFPLLISFSFSGITKGQFFVYFGMALFFVFVFVLYKKQIRIDEKKAVERRLAYLASAKDLSEEVSSAIRLGKVLKNMKEEEVLASVGLPGKRKILTTEPVRSEVLIYRGLYVHMHTGIVQNWEYHKKILGF